MAGTSTGRIGAYPGTFDPPTIAHLAIAEAAVRQCGLDRVDLILSVDPLGKPGAAATLERRLDVLKAVAARRDWLGVAVTEHRHLVDIAAGYDVLVLGADKWAQVLDVAFYNSVAHRDRAVAGLPALAVAPRGGLAVPDGCTVLDVDLGHVSSTAARAGRHELIVPEALSHRDTTPPDPDAAVDGRSP
jgi:nicotinate-nucleotide adenylyltransferase